MLNISDKLSLSLSLSHTHIHTHTHTLSLSLSLSLTHTHTHTHTHSLSLSLYIYIYIYLLEYRIHMALGDCQCLSYAIIGSIFMLSYLISQCFNKFIALIYFFFPLYISFQYCCLFFSLFNFLSIIHHV